MVTSVIFQKVGIPTWCSYWLYSSYSRKLFIWFPLPPLLVVSIHSFCVWGGGWCVWGGWWCMWGWGWFCVYVGMMMVCVCLCVCVGVSVWVCVCVCVFVWSMRQILVAQIPWLQVIFFYVKMFIAFSLSCVLWCKRHKSLVYKTSFSGVFKSIVVP